MRGRKNQRLNVIMEKNYHRRTALCGFSRPTIHGGNMYMYSITLEYIIHCVIQYGISEIDLYSCMRVTMSIVMLIKGNA